MHYARFDVLSYGTLGVDRILRVPHWPRPDVSTHALEEGTFLGGKATNSAVNLAAWGASVAISGTTIGRDEVGKRFFELLQEHPKISTMYVAQSDQLASMYCCILVDPEGERAIVGVNTDAVIATKPTQAMISDARVLTLDLYGGDERVEAARLARTAGRPVVIGDLRDAEHPILAYATVAIASTAEVRVSYPGQPTSVFVTRIQQKYPIDVILTDGARQVTVFGRDRVVTSLMPPKVPVIDATGAGDAFRAGVTYGVLQGWDLSEAAALGTAAGSLNVQRSGAAVNPPALADVQLLAAEILRSKPRL